jgi:hypothetical protein
MGIPQCLHDDQYCGAGTIHDLVIRLADVENQPIGRILPEKSQDFMPIAAVTSHKATKRARLVHEHARHLQLVYR